MRLKKNSIINDLKKNHLKDKASFDNLYLWTKILFKPSIYLSWVFITLGVSANQVTWSSIFFALIGCILIATGGHQLSIFGILLINIWYLMDCVDGHIARYLNTSSNYGAFIDNLGAILLYAFIYIAIGFNIYSSPDLSAENFINFFLVKFFNFELSLDIFLFIIFGLVTSFSTILRMLVSHSFNAQFSNNISTEGEHKIKGDGFLKTMFFWIKQNIFEFSGFLLPLLLVMFLLDLTSIYLLVLMLWSILELFVGVILTIFSSFTYRGK